MKTTMTGRLILPNDLKGPVYLVGRQPIFTRELEVFAYELLYRSSRENYVNVMDGDQATLAVLMNTFSKAGLNTLVGSKKAFINLTRNFILGHYPMTLPANRAVLEILEDIDIDAELIAALKDLVSKGYKLAIDDMIVWDARAAALADLATFAKVDIASIPPTDLPQLVQQLKKKSIFLVAEKVETPEEYELCRLMGFDFFQGFFFCRPEIVPLRKFETSRLVILQVMAKLQKPDVDLSELERIFSMDVTLGYRLLKLVNSGYFSFSAPISSIRHAIALIGFQQLRNWLSLFLMAKVDNKPHELCTQALLRAKVAESIAWELNLAQPDSYFLAGLFSVLDALLDMPMNEIVEGVNLSSEIGAALLERKGPIGEILQAVEGIETGNWDLILKAGLELEKISAIYIGSIEWTEVLRTEVLANNN